MAQSDQQLDPALVAYPSMAHAFDVALRESASATALVCAGRRLSYAQLGRAVAALAARLVQAGVVGQCVALALPNGVEAVVGVLAVWYARASLAPINPFYTVPELGVVLREAQPRLVITGADAAAKVRELAPG